MRKLRQPVIQIFHFIINSNDSQAIDISQTRKCCNQGIENTAKGLLQLHQTFTRCDHKFVGKREIENVQENTSFTFSDL